MHDTTQLQAVPAGVAVGTFPPPPRGSLPLPLPLHVLVPADAPNVINQAPMLPSIAPVAPRPPTAAVTNPFASSMAEHWPPAAPTAAPPARRGGARRALSRLLLVVVIAALAYGGITYGSDLMELATGDETAGDTLDETTVPSEFPVPTAPPPVVRTATFTVERTDPVLGVQRQEITTDFDNGVTRILVDRGDRPDLEMMTVFDEAVVRRTDEATWYRIDRGTVPLDAEFGRARWVRTLDELVPAGIRPSVTIDQATESSVGTTAGRRLVMSIDPAALVQPTIEATPVVLPPGVNLQLGAAPVPSLQMEIWVDDAGIVRKSILPAELGGETITVTALSPDEFLPVFPTADTVQPLTAAAIFRLGL